MNTKKLITHASAIFMLALPTLAHAQGQSDPASSANALISTSTTGLSSTGITVGVVLTVINLSSGEKALQHYLNSEKTAVVASLATGGGQAAGDLAAMFGVAGERRAHFASLLRANRRALTDALGEGEVSQADAGVFMGRVIEMMRDDERLRNDLPEHLLTT